MPLTISEPQYAALAAPFERAILAWHQDRLEQRFPDVKLPADFVPKHREAARHAAVAREEDVATYLDLVVMYGPDFPRQPWAAEVMTANSLSGAQRMSLLGQILSAHGVAL